MITYFGLNNRGQIATFQQSLIEKNLSPDAKFDPDLSTQNLGRNWGGFIWEKNNKKLLVFIDSDDGSGGTPSDCKIVWTTLYKIHQTYKPHDMIILKCQVNRDPEYNQFYPFKEDVYPLGIWSDDPKRVFLIKTLFPKVEQDIDVFFAGGLKHAKYRPNVWPKNRDIRKWWSGSSVRGYKKLLEIREKRPDIKFALFDDSIPPQDFYSLMRRSKICVDLPGVGLSSRKFYEYMVFGKCVLSLRQQYTSWPCEENVHYFSMGEDLDYDSMEEKIDFLLSSDEIRNNIENNVSSIHNDLTLEAMVQRAENIIVQKISNIDSYVIQY